MAVHFDEDTGRLRLDRPTFVALTAWVTDADPEIARLDELQAAGVFRGGEPHPALLPGLRAVAEPFGRLRLAMRDGEGQAESGEGWLSDEVAALLLDLPDGLVELVAVPMAFLPAALARILELGPRPRPPTDSVQVRPALLAALLNGNQQRREQALREAMGATPSPETEAALHALASGLHRESHVRTRWVDRTGEQRRRALHLLDTHAGLWLTEAVDDLAVAWPTTPTAIWRSLVRLLPPADDLA